MAQYLSACQISSKSVKRSPRCGDLTVFQNSGRPPSWICWVPWTIYDDYSVVSIVVQNLVELGAVVSIIRNYQYFAHLAWQCLFTMGFYGGGNFIYKMGSNINENPKRHILARVRIMLAIKREYLSTGVTTRGVNEKECLYTVFPLKWQTHIHARNLPSVLWRWPSWCHCHSLSLASVKSRLVLPFSYRLTWVVGSPGQRAVKRVLHGMPIVSFVQYWITSVKYWQ